MKIVELKTKEQFKSLKRQDRLIVQWEYHPVSGREFPEITMTKIWGVNYIGEVIVRSKDNLYFNIDSFLQGKSCAKQVFQVVEEEELKECEGKCN